MVGNLKKRNILVWVFAFTFLAIGIIATEASLQWINRPFPGFFVGKALNVYPIAVPDWTFHSAGLRAKDRLQCVNDVPIQSHTDLHRVMRTLKAGSSVRYQFSRGDRLFEVTGRVSLFGFRDWLLTFGVFLLIATVYLTMGLIVFYLKARVDAAAVFALFCCSVGLFFLTYFDAYTDINLVLFLDISLYLVPPLMLHLAFIFPEKLRILKRSRWLVTGLYLLFAGLWQLKAYFELNNYQMWTLLDTLSDGLIFVSYLIFIGILVHRSRRSVNTLLRKRAQMALLGLGMAFFIPSIAALFNLQNGILTHNFSFVTAILFPLYLGYAVLKHNFFNADRVVVNSVFYVLFSMLLVVLFLLLASLTGLVFNDGLTGKNILLTVFFTLLVMLLSRMQHTGHTAIARFFYRGSSSREQHYRESSALLRTIRRLNQRSVPVLKRFFTILGIRQAAILFQAAGGMQPFCEFSIPGQKPRVSRETAGFLEQHGDPVTPFDLSESPLPIRVIDELEEIFRSTEALVLLPIMLEQKLLGCILVGERPDGAAFRKQDLEILQLLAGHLAVARENTILMEKTREQDRVERELEIASGIQRHFLPQSINNTDWYEVGVYYRPAREVGGDLYDIIQDDPEAVTIFAGDVSGKGIPAALFSAVSSGLIKAGNLSGIHPGEVLREVNNRLRKIRFNRLNLALCCARFERKKKRVFFANAGFPFPLRIREGVETLQTGGLPLAVQEAKRPYRQISMRYRSGDLFLFFSDGMTDAKGRGGQRFGEKGIIAAALEHRRGAMPGLLAALVAKFESHLSNREVGDDCTLIALRIR